MAIMAMLLVTGSVGIGWFAVQPSRARHFEQGGERIADGEETMR